MARTDSGTFAVRFPSGLPPGDDGWHIDASFPPAEPDQREDPFKWRVYLCHPFLLHAAQAHHGTAPRILAQPPLHPRGWINKSFDPVAGTSPLEAAIRAALSEAA